MYTSHRLSMSLPPWTSPRLSSSTWSKVQKSTISTQWVLRFQVPLIILDCFAPSSFNTFECRYYSIKRNFGNWCLQEEGCPSCTYLSLSSTFPRTQCMQYLQVLHLMFINFAFKQNYSHFCQYALFRSNNSLCQGDLLLDAMCVAVGITVFTTVAPATGTYAKTACA